MSQESSSYTKHQSYTSGNQPQYTNTSPKNQFRYSSPYPSAMPSRRYATLDESEAVLPNFTTPVDMYIRQDLNSQPRYVPTSPKQPSYTQPTYSQPSYPQPSYPQTSFPQQQYSRPSQPFSDKSFDPLSSQTSTSSPSSIKQEYKKNEEAKAKSSTAKDDIISQLIDMGFTITQARVAVDATEGKSLQDALDLILQNQKAESEAFNKKSDNRGDLSSDDEESDEEFWRRQQEERKKNYLDQLHRAKPTPPIPNNFAYSTPPKPPQHGASVPPPHVPKNTTPTMDPILVFANRERKQGNYSFNKGSFSESEKSYTAAINAMPKGHGDIVLLLNNRAAAYIKQGKYNDCLKDCTIALDIAVKKLNLPTTPIMLETSTTMKIQRMKALHRKACALEGLRLYEEAIQVYEEYISLDRSSQEQMSHSIQRCKAALSTPPKSEANWKPANPNGSAFPDIDINIFIPQKATQLSQAELDEINNSKAVKEMRAREKQKELEEAEKLSKEDKVNAQLNFWKAGRDKNLRALLASLDTILWPGVQWNGVMITELLEPKKCKITYMKAIAKVHPDKLASNSTVEQRMLASGIFTTLNQAWDIFKTENDL